jgi:ABC-type antimicrobial peptide transport system permease subunit
MTRSVVLALLGVLSGTGVTLGLARAIDALLFNVSPTDPTIFVTIGLGVIAVVLLACYLPARRATKVDPMIALRCE